MFAVAFQPYVINGLPLQTMWLAFWAVLALTAYHINLPMPDQCRRLAKRLMQGSASAVLLFVIAAAVVIGCDAVCQACIQYFGCAWCWFPIPSCG